MENFIFCAVSANRLFAKVIANKVLKNCGFMQIPVPEIFLSSPHEK